VAGTSAWHSIPDLGRMAIIVTLRPAVIDPRAGKRSCSSALVVIVRRGIGYDIVIPAMAVTADVAVEVAF